MIAFAYKVRKMRNIPLLKPLLQMIVSVWMVAFMFNIRFQDLGKLERYHLTKTFHYEGYRFVISCYSDYVVYAIVNQDNRHLIDEYVIFFKSWKR